MLDVNIMMLKCNMVSQQYCSCLITIQYTMYIHHENRPFIKRQNVIPYENKVMMVYPYMTVFNSTRLRQFGSTPLK